MHGASTFDGGSGADDGSRAAQASGENGAVGRESAPVIVDGITVEEVRWRLLTKRQCAYRVRVKLGGGLPSSAFRLIECRRAVPRLHPAVAPFGAARRWGDHAKHGRPELRVLESAGHALGRRSLTDGDRATG